ncbi:MAG: hypothetical protein ABIH86_02235 [Planctomycetota bacterium]
MARSVLCPAVESGTVTYSWTGHRHETCGGRDVIGVRGLSEIAILSFDLSPLKNNEPLDATLRLHRPDGSPGALPVVGLSTLRARWTAGTATDYALDPGASSYEFAETYANPADCKQWAGPGTSIVDVAFGNAGSRDSVVALPRLGEPDADGWWDIPVSADLVLQLALGFATALVIKDEKGQRDVRTRPHSVHSQFPPELIIRVQPHRDLLPPPALIPGSLKPARNGVELIGQLPSADESTPFEVDADFNGEPLELWRIPSVPSETGSGFIDLTGLIETGGRLDVRYVSRNGQRGEPLSIALPPVMPVQPDAFAPVSIPAHPFPAAGATVAVLFSGESLDANGRSLSGSVAPAIWRNDIGGALKTDALRGEIIELTIAAPGGSTLSATAPKTLSVSIETGRYVLPSKDGGVKVPDWLEPSAIIDPNVPVGIAVIDILVLKTTKPGVIPFTIRAGEITIHVELTVLDAVIPDELGFIVELNSYGRFARYYGMPGDQPEEAAIQRDYHRLAHRHRCNFNILPYTQMGHVYPGGAPLLDDSGKITDWSGWDERNGEFLSGDAFKDLPRAGVPVRMVYLPFFENWPGLMDRDYQDHVPMGDTKEDWAAALASHALTARPIAQAFAPGYADRLKQAATDFAAHLVERGWTKPTYISYWNNKHYYKEPGRVEGVFQITKEVRGTSWWCLDEPIERDDFLALKYFGDLSCAGFRDGSQGRADIRYCLDISRPQWDFHILDGLRGLLRVSSEFFRSRKLMERRLAEGVPIITYGRAHPPSDAPIQETLWCWRGASLGAAGILPWSSTPMEGFSAMNWLDVADPLSVICPVRNDADKTWSRPTLRLKAFRRGQQDVEFLRMWEKRNPSAAMSVQNALQSDGVPSGPEDAALPVRFRNPSPDVVEGLRRELRRRAGG